MFTNLLFHMEKETVDPGLNYSSERSRRFFPRYKEGERPTKAGAFKPVVTDEDINYLIRRDELAFRISTKPAGAVFNKWLTIHSDVPALKEKLDELFERLDVKGVFKQGYLLSKAQGYCLIALGFAEPGKDATEEPQGVTDIDYLHAIPKASVVDIHKDNNPASKTYGEISAYTLEIPTTGGMTNIVFPASRFLHWKNPFIDDDPKGISIYEPLFDSFTVKKNHDFVCGEAPVQMGVPLKVAYAPDNADKDEIDDFEAIFKNINSRSYFTLPLSYKMELMATNKALDMKPYTDYNMGKIAAGSVGSKMALLGTEAGAVTGAEVNTQEWYNTVSDDQRNYVEPMLRKFVKVLQFWKVVPPGSVWFEWDQLFEMDATEIADVNLKNAQATLAMANAFNVMAMQGFEATIVDEQLVFMKEGKPMVIPMLNSLLSIPQPEGARKDVEPSSNIRAPYLPDEEMKKLFDTWKLKTQDIENRFSNTMLMDMTTFQSDFLEVFRKAWEKEIGKIGADPSAGAASKGINSQASLYEFMDGWSPAKIQKFRKDLETYLNQAYEAGATQTLENMGINPATFRLEDTNALMVLKAEGNRISKDLVFNMHKDAMAEIANGLQAGESYAQINNRIAGMFAKSNKNIAAEVHKFVHQVANEARWDTMQKRGVEEAMYVTSRDDVVRPEHAQLDGQIMTREESMGPLSDFGCRCTTVPMTAFDRAVEDYMKRQAAAEAVGGLV